MSRLHVYARYTGWLIVHIRPHANVVEYICAINIRCATNYSYDDEYVDVEQVRAAGWSNESLWLASTESWLAPLCHQSSLCALSLLHLVHCSKALCLLWSLNISQCDCFRRLIMGEGLKMRDFELDGHLVEAWNDGPVQCTFYTICCDCCTL